MPFYQKKVGEMIITTAVSLAFIIYIMISFVLMLVNVNAPKKDAVTNYLSNDIQAHDEYINIYGMIQRGLGKKAIEDFTIFKTNYGKLTSVCEKKDVSEIKTAVSNILPIFAYCEGEEIPCVYLTGLLPAGEDALPYEESDYSHLNAELLKNELDENGINVFDLRNMVSANQDEMFYYTDHHWTTATSFSAFQIIVESISEYIESDVHYADIDKYEKMIIPNAFLGSYGIKVGKYYAGKDSFQVLIPKGDTLFKFESYDNIGNLSMTKSGAWIDALMDQSILDNPNYNNKYNAWLNTQAVENRIINENVDNNTKILLISHSYGRPLAQYMALCFKEVRILDPQKGRFTGNYIEYIENFEPDIVLFLGEFEGEIIGIYDTSVNDKISQMGEDRLETSEMLKNLEDYLLPVDEEEKIDFANINVDDHQFFAYCLKAECSMGNRNKINELTKYLLDHSDEDRDGIPGWGLLFEWDAFSDGSVNPVGQVYAIKVANVLDAFMDALNSGVLDEELRRQMIDITHQVTMNWNENYYTQENDTGKSFFWYSTSASDDIECINISAKMAGVFARVISTCSDEFSEEEKGLVYDNIDACIDRLLELAITDGELVTWDYLSRNSTTNDCIHHAFILEGLQDYQLYRGKSVSYNVPDLNEYIKKCTEDGYIYSTPDHLSYRCFDTDAVRWIGDREIEAEILLNSYDRYFNRETDIRQMAFLFNAFAFLEYDKQY